MAKEEKTFPDGFLWGAATASYQVEGGIENTDWAEAARQGEVHACGRACDHYNRYEADFDLAKSLGHTAHRFSIEWARIEPFEGKFDQQEIEHYRQVLGALKARGIVPFVTLWHFTQPLWFSTSGGFLRNDSAEIFARYCTFVVEHLGGEADFWMTINEPEVWASNGYLRPKWPPFLCNPLLYMRVTKNLEKAHKAAYRAIKEVLPAALVGIAKHNMYFDASKNIFCKPMAWFLDRWWNHSFLHKTRGHHDFIGLNHYFHKPLGWKVSNDAVRSDMGWELHPESLYQCIMGLKRYNVPIYITENGLADADDSRRAAFVKGYVTHVLNAIKDGADVCGYLYWSLLDNYEWAEGFSQRFGLVEVNYETLERRVRPSAKVYETIIRTNTLPMDVV